MDPVKIIIFVAAFAFLLWLGRVLSSAGEVHAAELPVPQPSSEPENRVDAREQPTPALIGSEIEFPVKLPPVTRRSDGTYNRPNFLNYYFSKTDLIRGPADPACFFDQLFLEAQDPENEHTWTYMFTVATPSGLSNVLAEEKFASLYIDSVVVIVPRWDLSIIMQTVAEEIMKSYGQAEETEMPAINPNKTLSH